MQINDMVHGFRVTRVRPIEELNATLWEMRHEKTGAELCWIDREEENKAFYIAFKTLPEDSTGVFHIIEHSVLCGSDKYPVKEPFVELLKSSMNTFLNAMTFQDMTMYPVASRNPRDLPERVYVSGQDSLSGFKPQRSRFSEPDRRISRRGSASADLFQTGDFPAGRLALRGGRRKPLLSGRGVQRNEGRVRFAADGDV